MRFINTLIYSNNTGIRISRHVLFWLVDLFNWLVVTSSFGRVGWREVYFFLLIVPLPMAATYFILYYLIPRLSGKDDKSKLFLWIIVVLIAMGCTIRAYRYFIVVPFLGLKPLDIAEFWNVGMIIGEIFKWLAVISMAVAIKLIKSKTELQQKHDQLQQEKRIAELSFLKLQMHPHFLFNTLNTLYSETIRNSENAGKVVIHLSNLLRFMLEECNKPLISIEKEIKVIKDYIELEKLRHGDRLQVSLRVPESPADVMISPLLFLPFVENSFKHSLNNIRGQVHVAIDIALSDRELHLVVENDQSRNPKINGYTKGTGIVNIRRQLDLLYHNEHSLTIDDRGDKYRISLLIPSKHIFQS
jgi:two-component system, LytTR family, sensor kinase